MKVTDSDKDASLVRYGINYSNKNLKRLLETLNVKLLSYIYSYFKNLDRFITVRFSRRFAETVLLRK